MDLWKAYVNKSLELSFGTAQILLNTGDRHNSSLAHYLDRCIEIKPNSSIYKNYSYESRYIRFPNITFDLVMTFFDVNTSSIFAFRTSQEFTNNELLKITSVIKKMESTNLECRAIGMQNNYLELLPNIKNIHKKIPCKLAELDLFGKEQRNILIDTKTGMSYNLLMENRIYRPGELLNKISYDEFEKTKSKLTF